MALVRRPFPATPSSTIFFHLQLLKYSRFFQDLGTISYRWKHFTWTIVKNVTANQLLTLKWSKSQSANQSSYKSLESCKNVNNDRQKPPSYEKVQHKLHTAASEKFSGQNKLTFFSKYKSHFKFSLYKFLDFARKQEIWLLIGGLTSPDICSTEIKYMGLSPSILYINCYAAERLKLHKVETKL